MQFRSRIIDMITSAPADAIAISAPKSKTLPSVSYSELGRFLGDISTTKLMRSQIIGIYANRNTEAYLAVLSAFILGKTFVPLNPKFPAAKLEKIIEFSGVDLILSDTKSLAKIPDFGIETLNLSQLFDELSSTANNSADLKAANVKPSDIAYHLFTSGSTGDPKGVPISYSNLNAYVTGISELVEFGTLERFSQFFDLSFDLSMHDIFVCFYHQGTLVAASDFDLMLPVKYLEKNQIDHWFSVPVLAEVTVRNFEKQPTDHKLKTALFCGEALPVTTALKFQKFIVAPSGSSWNLYGPTEATIAFTARKIEPLDVAVDVFTLGQGFGANHIAIETKDKHVIENLTHGTEGELLLGGSQIFEGYAPQVDANIFVNTQSNRYYRSGDLVRVQSGEVCYIGRKDSQIKIRGHRVELGEIEGAFRKVTGIDLVVAFTTGTVLDREISLAYQAPKPVDALGVLKTLLPDYMIPSSIEHFVQLPTNANGKIDRKALAAKTS